MLYVSFSAYIPMLQQSLIAHLHVKQREAIMTVVRELINATSGAYFSVFQEYPEAMEEMQIINEKSDRLINAICLLTQ